MPLATPFEKNENTSATYWETIDYYRLLTSLFKEIKVEEGGITDAGLPLHLAILSLDGDFDPESIRKKGKRILLINNAIHPGEPDGVDATMMLYRDLLQDPDKKKLLEHLVLVTIPFYNIGGGLNRNSTTRVNQNGPEAYGFRGNSRNLDLNRDFAKCDSREAQAFNQIFTRWYPDFFVDNHTSNGADYQYTMTLLPTQKDKLEPLLGHYLENDLLPELYQKMEHKGWEMIPYVNTDGPPDKGIYGFSDSPRFSTGYAALYDCIGFMPETHMLKPFADRVRSTYAFMETLIRIIHRDHSKLGRMIEKARTNTLLQTSFDLDWDYDLSRTDSLLFKGYAAKYKPSEVSGLDRLYYDQGEPFEKTIPYYTHFKPTLSVDAPEAYIISQAFPEVIDRLHLNHIRMYRLAMDVEISLEEYFIVGYKDRGRGPYEGHYLHSQVELEKKTATRLLRKGDYVAYTNQPGKRFLVSVLEPQAPDSYFCWNFFDSCLNQKEYFSDYVFEDLAAEFLKANPEVKVALEERRKTDPDFAASARAQLDFVYQRSPWHEPTHQLYPVFRLLAPAEIPKEALTKE